MPDRNLDLILMLGKVDAQIANLSGEIKRTFEGQESIENKINLISTEFLTTRQKLHDLEKRLQNVEQPVAQIKIWQQRGIGILSVICLSSVFIGEAAKSFIEKLCSKF